MKIVVISDVHQNAQYLSYALEQHANADAFVFTGDYFDSSKSPPAVLSFRDTCKYVQHLTLQHPLRARFRFCVGNHDMKYIFENNKPSKKAIVPGLEYYCSGVTKSKIGHFRKEFFDNNLYDDYFTSNFKLAHQIGPWTFSHAGICLDYLPYHCTMTEFVNVHCESAWRDFRNLGHYHNRIISDVGVSRYGNAPRGGVLWCDWQWDFVAHERTGKQVVGHTRGSKARVVNEGTNKESWNLDCTQKCIGIINNDTLTPEYIEKIE
jgi:predicted MPP superfamily phosphohydrolase